MYVYSSSLQLWCQGQGAFLERCDFLHFLSHQSHDHLRSLFTFCACPCSLLHDMDGRKKIREGAVPRDLLLSDNVDVSDEEDRPIVKRRKIAVNNQYQAVYDNKGDERSRKMPYVKLWLQCEMVDLMLRILRQPGGFVGLKEIRFPGLKLTNAFGNFDTNEHLVRAIKKAQFTIFDTQIVCKDNRNKPNQTHKAYFEGPLYNVFREALRRHFGVTDLALGSVRRMDGCTLLVPPENVDSVSKESSLLGLPTKVEAQQSSEPRKTPLLAGVRLWKPKKKSQPPHVQSKKPLRHVQKKEHKKPQIARQSFGKKSHL